jgi:hypothetical protein
MDVLLPIMLKMGKTLGNANIVAAPVTFEIKGEQYVSIAAGWGGAIGKKKM